MEIINYKLGEAKSNLSAEKICYALGFFDGVHIGHRELIGKCVRYARSHGLRPAVFTFPAEGGIKASAPRIYLTEERLGIFEELGIELTVLCDFESVRELSPFDFVNRVLIGELGCAGAVYGSNFRFGKRASGNSETLTELLLEHSLTGITVPLCKTEDGTTVSATEIRRALGDGNIEYANRLLGSPYFLSGTVEHGLGQGRAFGFPTVNMPLEGEGLLRRGVYKTELKIGEKLYTGLTNIGVCPTFGSRAAHAETTILDYSGDLYGQKLKIYFLEMIREEKTFCSGDELTLQIKKDMEIIKNGRKLD